MSNIIENNICNFESLSEQLPTAIELNKLTQIAQLNELGSLVNSVNAQARLGEFKYTHNKPLSKHQTLFFTEKGYNVQYNQYNKCTVISWPSSM